MMASSFHCMRAASQHSLRPWVQENVGLQADQQRIMRKLSAGFPGPEGDALREAISSNEHLVADRAQVCPPYRVWGSGLRALRTLD